MHPCLFRVQKNDKEGNPLKGQNRMCGKKAVIAYKVEFTWSPTWRQFKTLCFCSLHSPGPQNEYTETDFNRATLGALSYARHASVTNLGEVPVSRVRDARIEVAMDGLVDNIVRLMNNKSVSWATDDHWREVFERSIVEKAVRSVVNG